MGIPAGPVTIRYTSTIRGTHFQESGERIGPARAPVKIFDMQLTRVGDNPWTGAGPATARQVVLP